MKAILFIPIFFMVANSYILAPLQYPINNNDLVTLYTYHPIVFLDNNNILYMIYSENYDSTYSNFYIYDLSKYQYIKTIPVNVSGSFISDTTYCGIIQNYIFLNNPYSKILYLFNTITYNSNFIELSCNQIYYDDSKIYCIQSSPYIYDHYSFVIYDVLSEELNTIKLPYSEGLFKDIYPDILVINDTIYFFDRCNYYDFYCYIAMYNFYTFEYSSTDRQIYADLSEIDSNFFNVFNFNNQVYFDSYYYDPVTKTFNDITIFDSNSYRLIGCFKNKMIIIDHWNDKYYFIFDVNSKSMTQITSDYYDDNFRSFYYKGLYPFNYIGDYYIAQQRGEINPLFYNDLKLLVSPDNSISPSCNNGGIIVNNKCNCAPNFAGDTCNECSFPNFSDKCYSPSECNITNGKLNWGKEGDGICTCSPNWKGNSCNNCVDGFYLPDCLPCPNCNNGSCNPNDGTCICYLGYYGKYCNDSGYTPVTPPVTPNSTDSGYNDEPSVGIPTIGIVVLSVTFPALFLSTLLYQRMKSLKRRNIVISIPSIFGISLVTSDAYRKF